jgi:nucleoid-associated protein YgaU
MGKMLITAYKDNTYLEEIGRVEVNINPSSYSTQFSVQYTEKNAVGQAGTLQQFGSVNAATIDLSLIFDGTGIIYTANKDVGEQIEDLKAIIYSYNGSAHSPNHLQFTWSRVIFEGVLTSMSVSYSLFKSDGTPLRATVKLNLKESRSLERISKEANQSSPDMTHIRVVREGDTLPLMAYRIYGDSTYFMEVARINGIKNFRDIKPGDRLTFPPLKK